MQPSPVHHHYASLQSALENAGIELNLQRAEEIRRARIDLSRALYGFIREWDQVEDPAAFFGTYFYEHSLQLIAEARDVLQSAYQLAPTYS